MNKNKILMISLPISGFSLSIIIIYFIINLTILNTNYQKKMFEKYDIYSYVTTLTISLKEDLSSFFKNDSTIIDKEKVLTAINKNLNEDIIRKNIDTSLYETFDYIKDNRKSLPDIYIYTGSIPNTSEYTSSDFKKINIGSILSYFNKDEVLKLFSVFKLIYFAIDKLFIYCLILLTFLILISPFFYNDLKKILKYISYILYSCSGFLFMAYLYFFIIFKNKIDFIFETSSLASLYNSFKISPFSSEINYSIKIYFIASISALILIASILVIITRKLNFKYNIKYHPLALFIMSISFFMGLAIYTYAIADEINKNKFTETFTNVFYNIPNTEIISAKDESIYSLSVEILEKDTSLKLSNIKFSLNAKFDENGKTIIINGETDKEGKFKVDVKKGNYKLSFNKEKFPKEYEYPAPYIFEIKSSGTTVLQIPFIKKTSYNIERNCYIEINVTSSDFIPVKNTKIILKKFNLEDISNQNFKNNTFFFYNKFNSFNLPKYDYIITNKKGLGISFVEPGLYLAEIDKQSIDTNLYKIPESFQIEAKKGIISKFNVTLDKVK